MIEESGRPGKMLPGFDADEHSAVLHARYRDMGAGAFPLAWTST